MRLEITEKDKKNLLYLGTWLVVARLTGEVLFRIATRNA